MIRPVVSLICFALMMCVFQSTSAQTMRSDPSGPWGGTIATEEGPGGLEITLTRAGAEWRATMRLRLEGQEMTPAIEGLVLDRDQITFTTNVGNTLLKFNGNFAGDTLKGTVDAYKNGAKVGAGTFDLKPGGTMPALDRPQTGGQMADPTFNAKVDKPAYKNHGPKVLFDEAHHNFHTATGRYKPFADLITNDGYQVVSNKEKFSPSVLKGYRILVISNALGAALMSEANASSPAFTEDESHVVRDWVRDGGSLLLIADHAPMGSANQVLATPFHVDMSKMYTVDPQNSDQESRNPGFIVYTRASGRLADHPVTRGRDESERVNKVITFTGQSLKGPADSFAFLKLADTAMDTMSGPNPNSASASGRAQGIAIKFGEGRVVMLGEAGMLSAQVVGEQQVKFGMNRPGIDNRQLALNIMHWLSGLLK
jgi:hypothetical protein